MSFLFAYPALGLVAAWLLVVCPLVWAISWLLGWHALARRCPAAPVRPGAQRGWTGSVRFGRWAGYHGCVVWAVDDDHLHLRLWPIFIGHRAISIPWAAAEFRATRWGIQQELLVDGDVVLGVPRTMVMRELAVRAAIGERPGDGD